jgi:hypothetical protein
MTKKLPPWPLCLDCGVNIFKVGDYCNLHDTIWKDELRLKDTDNMCIKCIEVRLGRKLSFVDFSSVPPNVDRTVKGYKMSDLLIERLGLTTSRKRKRNHVTPAR